jgi:hypothetical protein
MGLKDLLGKLKSKTANRVFVNRAPRVRVNYLHDMEFLSTSPLFRDPLKLDNISSSGIGLFLPKDTDVTSLIEMRGELRFANSSHVLILRIVRFNGDSVGSVIENSAPEFQQALQKYFESELAALDLRSTSADYLKAVSNGTPHWFQGSNNCDLSYISSGNDVVEFALTAFGNHLEGGVGKPLRLSEVSPQPHAYGHKGSNLLNGQRAVDPKTLVLAKRMISAVAGLPEDHRASLLNFLNL